MVAQHLGRDCRHIPEHIFFGAICQIFAYIMTLDYYLKQEVKCLVVFCTRHIHKQTNNETVDLIVF